MEVMKLRQVVCDKTELFLSKEKKKIKYNDIFEVSDERAKEILKATYHNRPVVEVVKDTATKNNNSQDNKK